MGALSLNTNLAALRTERRLGVSTTKLEKSFERLSSGLRINGASDDAAGLAISESLRTDSRVFSQGVRNLNDGVSLTNIAESALSNLTNIVTRLQELAEQSANGTLSNTQRKSLDAEAQALAKEYFRISRVADFNGLRLFDGSTQGLRFQAGFGDAGGLNAALGGKLGTGTVSGTTTYLAEGEASSAVQLGDLNRDGYLDIVTAGDDGSFNGYATIRLGRGDGSFGEATSYTTESGGSDALVLEDLNGDEVLDLVTAGKNDSDDGFATIRLGRGDGTFEQAKSYSAAEDEVEDIALGDLNGDGLTDLVTTGQTIGFDGYVSIRFGCGDGTFGETRAYTLDDEPLYAAHLFDLNSDSILDLVTAGNGGAFVQLGCGDGTFADATSYAAGEDYSRSLALNDLNGDGIIDLVTAGALSDGGGVATVRFGRGDGTFAQATSYSTEQWNSSAVTVGDLNGDGLLDLVTGGSSSGPVDAYVTVRLNLGNGTFAAATSVRLFSSSSSDDGVSALAVGDINGDGVMDVIGAGVGRFGASYDGAVQLLFGETRDGISPLLPFSLKTKADSLQAIPMFKQALTRVSTQQGAIGALQSRIGTALSNLQVAGENYDSARSQITDVDVASESAELLKTQIIQQGAAAILSQANNAPQLALQLLKGG